MRLDEEKLEALRSWGERLQDSGDAEAAAVGRAILMLVDEIDRLHIELWHVRIQPSGGLPVATVPAAGDQEEPVASTLRTRLQALLGRGPVADPAEQPAADVEGSSSAEAWIAGLRREH